MTVTEREMRQDRVAAIQHFLGTFIGGLCASIEHPDIVREALQGVTALINDDKLWNAMVEAIKMAPAAGEILLEDALEIVEAEERKPKLSVVQAEEGEDE